MLGRLPASITLALMGVLATTGLASAADYSDRTEVMVGMGIVVLAILAVLFVIFLVKQALGIDHHGIKPGEALPDPHASHGEHGDADHAETGETADETHSTAPTPIEPVGGHH